MSSREDRKLQQPARGFEHREVSFLRLFFARVIDLSGRCSFRRPCHVLVDLIHVLFGDARGSATARLVHYARRATG